MNMLLTPPEPARPNPANPDEASAYLLTLIMGDPDLTTATALEAQRQRVAVLRDPTSAKALDELARQLPILEALFQRFSADAVRERRPDKKAVLLRAALSAQQAHARTFALLRGLALQGRDQATVVLLEGHGDDSDHGSDSDSDHDDDPDSDSGSGAAAGPDAATHLD